MYIVPGVPLIAQTLNNSCWFASAQMLIQWRRGKTRMTERGLMDPSENLDTIMKFAANNGISDAFILNLVADLGLVAVPPLCATLDTIGQWLHNYGPLWTNGTSHITVIAGVDYDNEMVLVHNPLPVNVGARQWRSKDWLDGIGAAASYDSLDPETNSGVFLHCPR
jgi:hypothetical protein